MVSNRVQLGRFKMEVNVKKNNQDTLARAYAMLQGLKNNIAGLTWVAEIYVTEYHMALDMLESVGIDTTQFRISASKVRPRVTASYSRGGETHRTYSQEKYIPKELLLAKLDGILIYFEIATAEKPRKIGFSPPDK